MTLEKLESFNVKIFDFNTMTRTTKDFERLILPCNFAVLYNPGCKQDCTIKQEEDALNWRATRTIIENQ